MQDRDADLFLRELGVLDVQDVAGVGHDAVDELGVCPGEPVAEERALAVAVHVDLADVERTLERLDDADEVVAVLLPLHEVERLAGEEGRRPPYT